MRATVFTNEINKEQKRTDLNDQHLEGTLRIASSSIEPNIVHM